MRTFLSATAGSRLRELLAGPPLPLALALFHGFVAVFVAVVPLEFARGVLSGAEATAAMAAVVALVSWRAGAGAAAGIAGMGWLMLNAFVVHQYGDLGWDGHRDVLRMAALLAAALTASGVNGVRVRVRRVRPALVIPPPRSPDRGRVRHQGHA